MAVRRSTVYWLLGGCAISVLIGVSVVGLFALTFFLHANGPTHRLRGRWVRVDKKPSAVSAAMMSGSLVVSDQVYEFSSMGGVKFMRYAGSPKPHYERKGRWRFVQDINKADDETVIEMRFEDNQSERLYIRFLDGKTANFRRYSSYGSMFYQPP